jgi:hypothetical protein
MNQLAPITAAHAHALIAASGPRLENAALMANHASTRTTQLYDRRAEKVRLDEVERILV